MMTIRQIWRLWAALLVIEMLIVLNLRPPAPTGSGAKPYSIPLADLPEISEEIDLGAARAELKTTQIWGEAAKGSEAGPSTEAPPPGWTLAGVFMVGDRRSVILRFEGDSQPPRQLEAGDLLPNGGRIREIEREKVLVEPKAGRPHWVPINRID